MKAVLQDMGVDMAQMVPLSENHAQWPHGQITILVKPEDKQPEGAVLIDMHDLFILSNGLKTNPALATHCPTT